MTLCFLSAGGGKWSARSGVMLLLRTLVCAPPANRLFLAFLDRRLGVVPDPPLPVILEESSSKSKVPCLVGVDVARPVATPLA
jgi:hypothetical protein